MTRRVLSLSEVEPGMVVTVESGGDRFVRSVYLSGGTPCIFFGDKSIPVETFVREGFSVSIEVEDQEATNLATLIERLATRSTVPRPDDARPSAAADALESLAPVVEVEETPEPTDREKLVAIIGDPNHRGPFQIADAIIAAGWSPVGSEAQKIADWLRTPDWYGVNDGLADQVERVFVKGEKP